MILNADTLREASRGFQLLFKQGLTEVKPDWDQIAMRSPSTGDSETYGWLGSIPRMRKWLGDRVVNSLTLHDYNIKNEDFELTVDVPRNAFEDDKLGVFRIPFLGLGRAASLSPSEIIWALLLLGFTAKCYDGKAFFAVDHPNGVDEIDAPVTASNYSTKKLSQDSFEEGYIAMTTLTNETGAPLLIRPNRLYHGPTLRTMAFAICKAQKLANLQDNPNQNVVEPYEVKQFGASKAWMLADTTQVVMPMILQIRRDPQFVAKDSPTDDNVMFQKKFIYGVDDRKAAGFALWQLMYGSKGTT